MPYIKPGQRPPIDGYINGELADVLHNPGELNYAITRLVMAYLGKAPFNYTAIAEVTGVLENVKQEFYRRVASGYEDIKRKENGDVYGA